MHGDFCFEPEIMEISPYCDLLRNKLVPVSIKFYEIFISNWQVVRPRTHHIEQTSDAI